MLKWDSISCFRIYLYELPDIHVLLYAFSFHYLSRCPNSTSLITHCVMCSSNDCVIGPVSVALHVWPGHSWMSHTYTGPLPVLVFISKLVSRLRLSEQNLQRYSNYVRDVQRDISLCLCSTLHLCLSIAFVCGPHCNVPECLLVLQA